MDFLDNFLQKFTKDIAIDLGTANIRVFIKGENKVLKEPCVVAINQNTGKVLAVGHEARKMIGRTPAHITAVQPLKSGVISDFNATEALIYYFVEKVRPRLGMISQLLKPVVLIGVPSLITEVEIKAVIDSAKSAGARKVFIVEEPLAAAIGSDLPIEDAVGNMIVDIGGGTTDIAVISMGGIVIDNTIKTAGDEMDLAIQEYIRKKYNLLIGLKMAEDLKINLGSALPRKESSSIAVKGQDLLTGLPKSVEISSIEVTEALEPVLDEILVAIKEAIERTPPEIVSDLILNGLYLAGGGALIKDIDNFFSNKLKVKVNVSRDPIFSVSRGLSKILGNIELLNRVQFKDFILR